MANTPMSLQQPWRDTTDPAGHGPAAIEHPTGSGDDPHQRDTAAGTTVTPPTPTRRRVVLWAALAFVLLVTAVVVYKTSRSDAVGHPEVGSGDSAEAGESFGNSAPDVSAPNVDRAGRSGSTADGDGLTSVYRGNGVTFEYPTGWREATDKLTSDATTEWRIGLEIMPHGMVVIEASPATASHIADGLYAHESEVVADFDSAYTRRGGGLQGTPERLAVAGLPALQVVADGVSNDGNAIENRMTIFVDGSTQYLINCMHMAGDEAEVSRGCEQIVSTFALDSTLDPGAFSDDTDTSGTASEAGVYRDNGVTFEYPAEWLDARDELRLQAQSGAGLLEWSTAFSAGRLDMVIIQAYTADESMAAGGLYEQEGEIAAQFDGMFAQLGGGLRGAPEQLTVAGRPALQVVGDGEVDGTPIESRVIVFVDGSTQYLINCQSTTAHDVQIARGCDELVDTFELESS